MGKRGAVIMKNLFAFVAVFALLSIRYESAKILDITA